MRPHATLTLAAVAALLLAGCADDGGPAGGPDPSPGAGFPATVGELTLQERPDRIVSLSPAATEMLFAVGAGPQVVAADEFSNYPPEAPTTDLSGFTPNVEAIASYQPDLVVVAFNPDGLVEQLGTLDIPVHVASDAAVTLDEVYAQIADIGKLTGHADEASDLVRRMADDIDKLAADVPPRDEPLTYYFELDAERFAYTSRTWAGDLLSRIGLVNITGDQDAFSVKLSVESIIDADPDLIFLADTEFGENAQTVSARDGWAGIEAVRTGQIVELDSDVASRWGPRIVDLLRAIVDAVSQVR
jgi:iron complex transport system substrate-binding protein